MRSRPPPSNDLAVHIEIKTTDLLIVNVQLLEWIDGDQDVAHIGVDEPSLVPFPQL